MRYKKGFTMIELLIIISIIGLIASGSLYLLQNARMKSRDAKRLSDMEQIQKVVQLYNDDYGVYPGDDDLNDTRGPNNDNDWYFNNSCTNSTFLFWEDWWGDNQGPFWRFSILFANHPELQKYVKQFPEDPGPTDHCYVYQPRNKGRGYVIRVIPEIEDTKNPRYCWSFILGSYCIREGE